MVFNLYYRDHLCLLVFVSNNQTLSRKTQDPSGILAILFKYRTIQLMAGSEVVLLPAIQKVFAKCGSKLSANQTWYYNTSVVTNSISTWGECSHSDMYILHECDLLFLALLELRLSSCVNLTKFLRVSFPHDWSIISIQRLLHDLAILSWFYVNYLPRVLFLVWSDKLGALLKVWQIFKSCISEWRLAIPLFVSLILLCLWHAICL